MWVILNPEKAHRFVTKGINLHKKSPTAIIDPGLPYEFRQKVNTAIADGTLIEIKDNSFENIKGNMNKLSSDLFMLSNDVQSSTGELNKKLFALNVLIQEEKERNHKLKLKLGIVEHKNNAATELIYDYKNMYSEEYLRNWALFVSILIIGTSISKISKNPLT